MKRLALLLLPFAFCASTVLRVDNATVPAPAYFDNLNLVKDGGLTGGRDAGSVANLECAVGGVTTRGCIEPGTAQTFSGQKTFTGTIFAAGGVDAGYLHTPDFHIEGSTLQCTDSVTPMIIQSNAPDSLTSTLTPAMRFYLGQAIGGSDLGWCFTDSTGTDRMCGTANGTWNFSSHVTNAGTATVAGTTFTSVLGAGGSSSGATPGGTGGAYSFTAGVGGSSAGAAAAGAGGSVFVTAGIGGPGNGAQVGGVGGNLTLAAGNGASGASTSGTASLASGSGQNATGSLLAVPGGPLNITAGAGGRGATAVTSAAGGAITITAGLGGDGNIGTAGTGGALTLMSGAAGPAGAVQGAPPGAVIIDTGLGSAVHTGGTWTNFVSIGTTNAAGVIIGRSTKTVDFPSNNITLGAGNLAVVGFPPTISSGFGTSPTVSTAGSSLAFRIAVGNPTGASGVIALGTATTGWNCSCADLTTKSATVYLCKQTASSTTTATIGNFDTAGASQNWVATDVLAVMCVGM